MRKKQHKTCFRIRSYPHLIKPSQLQVKKRPTVLDLDLPLPSVPLYATATMARISNIGNAVKKVLDHLDTNKVMGGDQVNPRLLEGCLDQLAEPLCRLFQQLLAKEAVALLTEISACSGDPKNLQRRILRIIRQYLCYMLLARYLKV